MKKIKQYIFNNFPRIFFFLSSLKRIIREFLDPSLRPSFEGWYGMTLYTNPPWINSSSYSVNLDSQFIEADNKLKKMVKSRNFLLTQFEQYKDLNISKKLNELQWRHYIVYWSSIFSANSTKSKQKNYVEMGVADGMTIFYAINAAIQNKNEYKAYLYDTWAKVLLNNPSTVGNKYQYDYLNVDITKKNLDEYKEHLNYKIGKIPDTFNGENEPGTVTWISIDLNSMKPTIDVLDYYWDRLEPGGIVLFDDYAQPAYIDTKKSVDQWISKYKNGLLVQLPTSQALLFKLTNCV